MKRGEVWWAHLDERCPVVLLDGAGRPELRAMRIVAPATTEQRRGFALLSGAQAMRADAGTAGIEVEFGAAEGLSEAGVVRVALPRDGHIFCTWLVTLSGEHLLERAGQLAPGKLDELANALRLAGIE